MIVECIVVSNAFGGSIHFQHKYIGDLKKELTTLDRANPKTSDLKSEKSDFNLIINSFKPKVKYIYYLYL